MYSYGPSLFPLEEHTESEPLFVSGVGTHQCLAQAVLSIVAWIRRGDTYTDSTLQMHCPMKVATQMQTWETLRLQADFDIVVNYMF
jgi:hypothetical protein